MVFTRVIWIGAGIYEGQYYPDFLDGLSCQFWLSGISRESQGENGKSNFHHEGKKITEAGGRGGKSRSEAGGTRKGAGQKPAVREAGGRGDMMLRGW